MRCVIVDDDNLSRMSIQKCVDRISYLECVAEYEDPVQAISEINKLESDVIFLDVEMPNLSGLEFISAIQTDAQVVLVSSKPDYAAEAFDYNVSDYITKPVTFERFCKSISKVKTITDSFTNKGCDIQNLFIKTDATLVKINLKEIQYIEALSDYVSIYTDKGRFVVLGTMKSMVNKLNDNIFVRVHRSYIVNLNRVDSIQDGMINIGENKIPVSRNSKEKLNGKIKLLN